MERLTNRDTDYEYEFCKDCHYLGEPNGCNRSDGECEAYFKFTEIANRLAELEDELENGTLLKAPCKVGDEMWILNDPYFVGDIFAMKVEAIEIRSDEVYLCGYHKEASEYLEARISFAFKTKEEAEKRLEELRG